jgi:predicted amino acid dehydrogenase
MDAARGALDRRRDFDARTGFIIHPTSVEYLVDYYFPSFRKYRYLTEHLEAWWNRISRFLQPDLVNVSYITSGGFTVESNMVAVPYLPGCLAEAMHAERTKGDQESVLRLTEIRDRIQEAVTLAKDIGDERVPTSMVGLGAYTSIVTDRGLALNDYEVPLTTGNAYTSALMFMGIRRAAELQGIDIRASKAAVVGGAGNIGTVIAALLCQCAGEVRIIGRREGGFERLRAARAQCLRELLQAIALEVAEGIDFEHTRVSGLGKKIYQTVIARSLIESVRAAERIPEEAVANLDDAVTELYGKKDGAPISLHTDLGTIRDCEIVAIATNSPDKNLVGPRNTKKGAVVCCASIPSNLSAAFKDHMDDYFVFDGGFARLPEGSHIDFMGMPGRTLAYGCLSETLLLAFEGRNRSFARGPLTVEQVQETIRLAEQHGFTLGEFKLGDKVRRT